MSRISRPNNTAGVWGFCPDGKRLITTFRSETKPDKTRGFDVTPHIVVALWDVHTGALLQEYAVPEKHMLFQLALSPDGKTLACASNGYLNPDVGFQGEIVLWDTQTGAEKHTLTWNTTWISSIAFSSDGKTLASGNTESRPGSTGFVCDDSLRRSMTTEKNVILWDVEAGEPLRVLPNHVQATSLAFAPDGSTLATTNIERQDLKATFPGTAFGRSDGDRPGGRTGVCSERQDLNNRCGFL